MAAKHSKSIGDAGITAIVLAGGTIIIANAGDVATVGITDFRQLGPGRMFRSIYLQLAPMNGAEQCRDVAIVPCERDVLPDVGSNRT